MEIGSHVQLRYVQRIIKLTGKKDAKQYVLEHEYEVAYRILELLNDAKLLYENYAPTRKETFNYYINGELLIVTDSKRTKIITMYHVTLDFENNKNREKVRSYVKKISKNNAKVRSINAIKTKQDEVSDHLEFTIEKMNGRISESLLDELRAEFQESIQLCIHYASETKNLRMENRELMSEMFIKLEKTMMEYSE